VRAPLALSLDLGNAYNLPQTLQRLLTELVHRFPCEAAYLAVRQGEIFRVEAVWNLDEERGVFFEIGQTIVRAPDRLSGELVETGLEQISVEPDEINALAPTAPLSPPFFACLAAPLRIGQRIIGLAVFLATHPKIFPNDSLARVQELARQASPFIENAVTLAEAERHLQRQTLLNELAAAASTSQDVETVARRVLRLLRHTFQTSRVGLFLLSADGNTLQAYGEDRRRSRKNSLTLQPALGTRALEAREPLRLQTSNGTQTHTLLVPLKYRGRPVGVLGLATDAPHPFSLADEQLLLVIASHLAGLIENVHLHEETRDRARNLAAIHHIVQQIVGLVDSAEIAQTTAALTAGQFECELVLILLTGDMSRALGPPVLIAEGVGGKLAGYVRLGAQYPVSTGVDEPVASLAREVVGGGRMSIPLRAGEQSLGVFHIIRETPFTENDRLVLESLGGVLSSVLLNARRYQQLQERIEAQNLAEKKMVEAARLAAIGEIAAGVAHELNNPLTTIAGFTELVLDDLSTDTRAQENLGLVLQEARRARDVVRRLLDFSRQDQSFKVPTDINEILGEVLALVHHMARASGVEIQYVPWDALPQIRMDRGQMKQVILNLVQNAFQAMPRGGTLLLQTTLEGRDERDWVALRVVDTGTGIPVELIARIFEPFFTTKPPGQGTGLGLSISNHIVVEHGGLIEVESEHGQGTRFTVWLPVEPMEGLPL
jgi:signal transduction histidine kinase